VAVPLVEHDMELVMDVSTHVVVLVAGLVLAEGSPAAAQADPAVRIAYLGERRSAGRAREMLALARCIPSCADPTRPAKYAVTTSGEHLRHHFVRTQAAAY
jgi:energy-coupling factor transporter ATP-binding protein EcfA2